MNKIKKWFYTNDGVEQNEINKQLVIIVVSVIVTVISVIGVTLSAFMWSDNSLKNQNLVVGNIVLDISSNSEALGSGLDYPVSPDQESSLTPYTFTITNNGNLSSTYKLSVVADDEFTNTLDTQYIYMSLDGGKTVNRTSLKEFENAWIDQGGLLPGESKTYELRIWLIEGAPNDVIGQEWHGKILLETMQTIAGEPNVPILTKGMIPVTYDDTNDVWVKADANNGWYNYDNHMWANAVTVTSENRNMYLNAKAGTAIPMEDINAMWVWIPRFKYKITNGLGSNTNLTSPPQIDVMFESGTESTGVTETAYRAGIGSDGTNLNYYTHPAFRNVNNITYDSSTTSRGAWDNEITGLWVGKFETGTSTDICNTTASEENCSDVYPVIKPDILSLRYQNVSTQFLTSLKFVDGTMDSSTGEVTFNGSNTYGLLSGTDTHMMKNTEWGAVAILSQSQYGKMGNENYSDENKEIYKNNSIGYYTGRSGGSPNVTATTYGTYSYNNKACSEAICTGSETSNRGTGASTTGTIYGVYDMSGGASEYTMGNWGKYANDSGFNGFSNSSGIVLDGISFPESKYYDLYQGTSSETIEMDKVILGDATWETLRWYSDTSNSINITYPWGIRGSLGSYNNTSVGVFSSGYSGGFGSESYGFHTVLIP